MRLDIFKKELFLFGAVQALALVIVTRLAEPSSTLFVSPQPVDIGIFLFYFFIATLFLLIFVRFSRTQGFLKVLWITALFGGVRIFFSAFFVGDTALLVALLIIYIYWRAPTITLHNVVLVMALPAIAAIFGMQIPSGVAALLLALFSVYDIVAVYVTKHMVVMASAFIKEKVIPGIVVVEGKGVGGTSIHEVIPGAGFSILGTGDLVFPAVLASSAYIVVPFSGVMISLFSLVGLFVTHTLFFRQRVRRPMPALPPIALGAIMGYVISIFFL
ncbi:MAG: hypothetical protein HYS57_00465 [Parcubacteria group bacterium]|nr:hypothetical protein [Parcubacteria group bacterium]